MTKYFGSFTDAPSVRSNFEDYHNGYRAGKSIENFPTEDEIIFAAYEGGDYEGEAHVLFESDGKLYEVNGSHCSCYGLEDQWTPEETSWEALSIRPRLSDYSYAKETRDAYQLLLDFRLGKLDDGAEENVH
jgi:hypothetical protein